MESPEFLPKPGPNRTVECRKWLVDKQQLRFGGEHSRQGDALQFTAGQGGRHRRDPVLQAETSENIPRSLLSRLFRQPAASPVERQGHIFQGTEMRKHSGTLWDITNVAALWREVSPLTRVEDRAIGNGDEPFVRPLKSRQHLDRQ